MGDNDAERLVPGSPRDGNGFPRTTAWPQSFPGMQRARSFFFQDEGRNVDDDNRSRSEHHHPAPPHPDSKWQCISPMTHHVIPGDNHKETSSSVSHETTSQLRKRRSRSFSDYIDSVCQPNSNYAAATAAIRHDHDHFQQHQHDGSLTIPELKQNDHDLDLSDSKNHFDNEPIPLSTATRIDPYHQEREPQEGEEEEEEVEQCEGTPKLPHGDINNIDTEESNPFFISILYGLINATIVLPVVMSFGNIIYRDDAFQDYMPVLIKLTLVSGMVHQLCFSTLSTLKFAVGSVQDAGLIFLSSMAADVAAFCREQGHDDTTMLATVTVGLGLAAAILGVGLIIIGKLGLARYVQMLPTCVVAGYLAYIGYFVGYSGLGIMAGQSALTLPVLVENFGFVLPGTLGGIFIYFSVQRFRHVAVLPTCIFFLLLTFYVGVAVAGSSIEEATKNGWIRKTEPAPIWYHTWDYIQLNKVAWEALPQLWMTEMAMLVVVALSSSLDVAAIELELKRPLHYNKELTMVGISNVLSGLTGGYTGSYIFSQSIFSLRIGIRSRVAGFALAFFQLLVILIPFPILSYVPNFFYGSLLSMICIDLMYEWLWDFRGHVTMAEYLIALTTFGLIYFLGVEYGILAGVGLYCLCRQLKINVGELKQIHPLEDEVEGDDDCNSIDKESELETTNKCNNGTEEAKGLLGNGSSQEMYQATVI